MGSGISLIFSPWQRKEGVKLKKDVSREKAVSSDFIRELLTIAVIKINKKAPKYKNSFGCLFKKRFKIFFAKLKIYLNCLINLNKSKINDSKPKESGQDSAGIPLIAGKASKKTGLHSHFMEKLLPMKSLGQNFLKDGKIAKKIIESAEIGKKDIVLEIGPGFGALTKELAKKARSVIAVEKDVRIIPALKKTLIGVKNVSVVEGDILKTDLSSLGIRKYKIVSNLAYNISLPTIMKFLEEKNPPQSMTLMIQKEVAQKICAPKSSLLKMAVNFYSKAKIVFYVPSGAFRPKPKIDGAVVKFENIQKNPLPIDKKPFFIVLKAGFLFPRKTILNNLSAGLKLKKPDVKKNLLRTGVDSKKRPEEISLSEWISLALNFGDMIL